MKEISSCVDCSLPNHHHGLIEGDHWSEAI